MLTGLSALLRPHNTYWFLVGNKGRIYIYIDTHLISYIHTYIHIYLGLHCLIPTTNQQVRLDVPTVGEYATAGISNIRRVGGFSIRWR